MICKESFGDLIMKKDLKKVKQVLSTEVIEDLLKREREEIIQSIFGFEDDWEHSETYKQVIKHRESCKKWGKEFCLDCFGGGLTQFTENLRKEFKKRCDDKWQKKDGKKEIRENLATKC